MQIKPVSIRHMAVRCLSAGMVYLSLTQGQFAQAAGGQVNWGLVDWPPYMVLKGGAAPAETRDLGDGVVDRLMAEVIRNMGGHEHRFQLANNQRLWQLMANGVNICYAAAYKTPEREAFAYFVPASPAPPLAIVLRKDRKSVPADGSGTVSLVQVLQTGALTGRLEAKRSYGPVLDKILADSPANLPRDLASTSGALLRPLGQGRFDYTLEYPMVVEYIRRQAPFAVDLEVLGMVEAQDWATGYIACTRNAWGRETIREIDTALRKAAAGPAIRSIYGQWLPETLRKQGNARINAFYDARVKIPLVPD